MIKVLCNILKRVIDYTICFYLILILSVMPFFNRNGYLRIGTDKSYFFNLICVNIGRLLVSITVIYLFLLVYILRREAWTKLKENLSVTDLFAASYGLILVISFFCSDYKENALWGTGGWYMGFWPQMFLVLTYFFVSKLWMPRKWMLYLGLAASLVVFALGFLNRFGVDPLGMDIGLPGFISTIGNINWYCGYLTSIFFAGAALLWQNSEQKLWLRLSLILYVTVGFGTLVSQGSDSGILAMSIVLPVMFCLSARDSERMLNFWLVMTLLGFACVISYIVQWAMPPDSVTYDIGLAAFLITGWVPFCLMFVSLFIFSGIAIAQKRRLYSKKVIKVLTMLVRVGLTVAAAGIIIFTALIAVNTVHPGSIGPLSNYQIFTFSAKWGSSRGATWSAGWRCFWEQNILHKLVGVGPDSMPSFLYQDGSPELLETVNKIFGGSILTNAHNEWLTVLVNTGILGVIAFGGMISTAIYRYLRKVGKNKIVCACGICLTAYTANNIFSFQQAMSVATIFVILGMGGAFLQDKNYIQ